MTIGAAPPRRPPGRDGPPPTAARVEVRPQPVQEAFLSSPADIVIFGGAAGGGKTHALLMETLRHVGNPRFHAILFRRTYPEIIAPGGLWPASWQLFPHLDAVPNESTKTWRFPSGATVRFSHMQHQKNVLTWLGAEIPLIGFDQVETFEASQFWYMVSRNRSLCGVRPYIRATANPRPGWLAELLAWWIDPGTGYPITERGGAVRWFVRREDVLFWADSWAELHEQHPTSVCPPDAEPDGIVETRQRPKSLTFVPARLTDNEILMRGDPEYLANLQILPRVDRERLERGNWLIGDSDGEWPADYFGPRIWFDSWEQVPDLMVKVMSLDPSKGKLDRTGDYSAWILLGVDRQLNLWVDADLDNVRTVEANPLDPGRRNMTDDGLTIYRVFRPKGVLVEVNGFQEWVATSLLRAAVDLSLVLPLYRINSRVNKKQRIRTLTPYFAQGRFRVRNTIGGRMLVSQLRSFPDKDAHDDGPDALKGAEILADYLLSGRNDYGIEAASGT